MPRWLMPRYYHDADDATDERRRYADDDALSDADATSSLFTMPPTCHYACADAYLR
jgi:hypothetical protein